MNSVGAPCRLRTGVTVGPVAFAGAEIQCGPETGRRIMRNCCQIDTACQCSFGALGALALILASAPEGTRIYNEASSLFSPPCVSPCLLIAIMMDKCRKIGKGDYNRASL